MFGFESLARLLLKGLHLVVLLPLELVCPILLRAPQYPIPAERASQSLELLLAALEG